MDISQYDKIVGAYNIGGKHWALLVSWILQELASYVTIATYMRYTNCYVHIYKGSTCKRARDSICRSIGWEKENDKSAKEALEVRL